MGVIQLIHVKFLILHVFPLKTTAIIYWCFCGRPLTQDNDQISSRRKKSLVHNRVNEIDRFNRTK